MTLFWGSTEPARQNPSSSTGRKIWILSTIQMSSGFPQTLFVPKFSHHLPRRAYIMVPITLSSNYLSIYLPDRLWLWGAKTKPNLSLKLSRSLTSCLMNECLKEKRSSAVPIWPTATMPWVIWSIHKVSGKKEYRGTAERRLCLAEDHPLGNIPHRLPIQQALNRERKTPAHQAFLIQKRRKTAQQYQHHVPRWATPGGPLGTLTKLGKNPAACLLLEKQNSHPQDNTHCYI